LQANVAHATADGVDVSVIVAISTGVGSATGLLVSGSCSTCCCTLSSATLSALALAHATHALHIASSSLAGGCDACGAIPGNSATCALTCSVVVVTSTDSACGCTGQTSTCTVVTSGGGARGGAGGGTLGLVEAAA
jgi:hypothetical protein